MRAMPQRSGAWWLQVPGGKRIRITAAGVLIGRSAQCEVVLAHAQASRTHAIVFAGSRGPRLAVLGHGLTSVNHQPVEHERDLADGDAIAVPGFALEIVAAVDTAPPPVTTSWVIESSTSGSFGIARTPFAIHGGADADLRIDGWPARVMIFHVSHQLEIETVVPVAIDGVETEPGDRERLGPGSVIAFAGEQMTVLAGGKHGELTTQSEAGELVGDPPVYARVEFLPRGGRLTVRQRSGERSVYLADRRCDLVATLLRPPDGHAAGEFIADDVLIPRIWPSRSMSRGDLNVLIHRTRRDLVRAELDGAKLLPRIPGGNATRFTLARGAHIELV
jgi:hypothetical protein